MATSTKAYRLASWHARQMANQDDLDRGSIADVIGAYYQPEREFFCARCVPVLVLDFRHPDQSNWAVVAWFAYPRQCFRCRQWVEKHDEFKPPVWEPPL